MGGLGITVPSSESDFCFEASVKITAPIVALITLQDIDVPTATQLTKSVKSTVHKDKLDRLGRQANNIYDQLSAPQHHLMDCSRERGASSLVTASTSMVSSCTRVPSETLSACGMVGSRQTCHFNVHVVIPFQSTMLWSATKVDTQL